MGSGRLVTPFAWSQPHDVNEHVAGVARELRRGGHTVPCSRRPNRARDLRAGRRALAAGASYGDGSRSAPHCLSRAAARWRARRRSREPRARTRARRVRHRARLRAGAAEPFVPRAARHARARRRNLLLTRPPLLPAGQGAAGAVAGPDRRAARDIEETAEAATERFPGDYTVISPGVDRRALPPRARSGGTSSSSRSQVEREAARKAIREPRRARRLGGRARCGRARSPASLTSRCASRPRPRPDASRPREDRAALLNRGGGVRGRAWEGSQRGYALRSGCG